MKTACKPKLAGACSYSVWSLLAFSYFILFVGDGFPISLKKKTWIFLLFEKDAGIDMIYNVWVHRDKHVSINCGILDVLFDNKRDMVNILTM